MKTYIANNRGVALLITLLLMMLLATVAIMSIDRSTTDIELSFNQLHEEQAFYLAEAGAERAFIVLSDSNSWRAGFNTVAMGDGFYDVSVLDETMDSSLADTILLVSVGNVDGAVATVVLTVVPGFSNPFKYAMFGEQGINLDRNTCTDSYNSDSGTYAGTQLDSLGNIGSNGTISSSKDVTFGGNVEVATPGGLSFGSGNIVNGDTTSTADSVSLDTLSDAEFAWAEASSGAPLGFSGSGYSYNSGTHTLTLGSSANLVLDGGVYYFSDILLGQSSTISVAAGADVTIYVTGTINLNQNSTINNGGTPSSFIVYSKGSLLQFDQGNIFYGAFYGPKAHIQYDQTTQVYGSLVGGTIQLDKGACFHYDRNLADFQRNGNEGVRVVAWGESQ